MTTNEKWVVGIGLAWLLLGKRRRTNGAAADGNMQASHALPDERRIVADMTLTDAEGRVIAQVEGAESGGTFGAGAVQRPAPVSAGAINAPPPSAVQSASAPPPPPPAQVQPATQAGGTTTPAGAATAPAPGTAPTFRPAALRTAASQWVAEYKRKGKSLWSGYTVAVQKTALLSRDGRYGPRTAGAIKWATGQSIPPWDPQGSIIPFRPPA